MHSIPHSWPRRARGSRKRSSRWRFRRHLDDAAPSGLDHLPAELLGQVEETADVEVEDLVPAFERILEGRRRPHPGRVVDEHVDRPHCGDQGVDGARIGAVGMGVTVKDVNIVMELEALSFALSQEEGEE